MNRFVHSQRRLSASYVLLVGLLIVLVMAGGASRPDIMGQVVSRSAAATTLVMAALMAPKVRLGPTKWVFGLLLVALALTLAQLIPLPPSTWQSLPGRDIFTTAAENPQPWRPLSISPGATVNAAASLIVPLAVFILALGITDAEHDRMPGLVLGLVAATMLVGVLQFAGSRVNNPLVNDIPGSVAGLFANRNHFALFLAFGCLIAPVWAVAGRERVAWRVPAALGLSILLPLVILATGSRAGILLGPLGLASGLYLARDRLARHLRAIPRPLAFGFAAAALSIFIVLVVASVRADRAAGFTRAMALDVNDDLRVAALPTIIAMVKTYFPIGTGFGTFDPVFRNHEPFVLLKRTYLNHAHNDWLEIILDGGLPALVLLLAAIGWWIMTSWRVWRREAVGAVLLGRLGSIVILLTLAASVVDYPARTPIIMALVVLAAVWLARGAATAPAVRAGRS